MPIFLCPEFIRDLQTHGDANFAKRVLQKVLTGDGEFRSDDDDHAYNGIDGAWIRYVSRKNTAYRAIYIRRGSNIYWYRAGEHSIENNLAAPKNLASSIPLGTVSPNYTHAQSSPQASESWDLLVNKPSFSLHRSIVSRRLIPHTEIAIVSPFLSMSLFSRTATIGKVLYDQIDDGATVTLITRPATDREGLERFSQLQADGISVMFVPDLHAKLYVFKVNQDRLRAPGEYRDLVILGSANFTDQGIVPPGGVGLEEACVALGPSAVDRMEEYLIAISIRASDIPKLRVDLTRQSRG